MFRALCPVLRYAILSIMGVPKNTSASDTQPDRAIDCLVPFNERKSLADIAQALNVSVGTARDRMTRLVEEKPLYAAPNGRLPGGDD